MEYLLGRLMYAEAERRTPVASGSQSSCEDTAKELYGKRDYFRHMQMYWIDYYMEIVHVSVNKWLKSLSDTAKPRK